MNVNLKNAKKAKISNLQISENLKLGPGEGILQGKLFCFFQVIKIKLVVNEETLY
jgi:hypothetical protein